MTYKNAVLSVGVLTMIVCILISGCSSNIASDSTIIPSTQRSSSNSVEVNASSMPSSTSNQNEISTPSTQSAISAPSENSEVATLSAISISNSDFNVYYNGLTLNEKTSLEELTAKFNFIPEKEDDENVITRAGGWNNDMDYSWYQVSYPNKEHEEIVFDYLYNVTLKSGRIVSIDLKTVPTKRGVAVGDNLEKIKLAYGNDFASNFNTDTSNYIDFSLNSNMLTFIYEKGKGEILSINIDYDSAKAMDEMDIQFGD